MDPVEFGGCTCGGAFESRRVEVNMTVEGETVALHDIAQGACPVCGSRVYKLDDLARLEATMRGRATDPVLF